MLAKGTRLVNKKALFSSNDVFPPFRDSLDKLFASSYFIKSADEHKKKLN